MLVKARKYIAGTFATVVVAVIGAPVAGAQGPVNQDGLVNVNIGDVTFLNDVNVGVGANVAATLCDIDVGPLALAVLGQAVAVDRSGRERTICQTDSGPVTISQN
jgi:hypothetical protein